MGWPWEAWGSEDAPEEGASQLRPKGARSELGEGGRRVFQAEKSWSRGPEAWGLWCLCCRLLRGGAGRCGGERVLAGGQALKEVALC